MLEGLLIINCYFCFGVAELGDFEYNFDTSFWGKHLQHGIILNAKVIEVIIGVSCDLTLFVEIQM